MNETNEFSFILKPSSHGIGVFASHAIPKDSHLRLFGDRNEEGDLGTRTRQLPAESVPAAFRSYCLEREGKLICPPDFGEMAIGWYLNHSSNPNAHRDENYRWHAARDIKEGEEVTINYNSLEEPDQAKEPYYGQ